MAKDPDLRPETVAARADGAICDRTGGVIPPIYPATTYARNRDYAQRDGRGYARDDNPTYEPAEAVLASLERATAARLFASGMAAVTAVFQALAPGDHVVVTDKSYFGTPKWLREVAIPWGLAVDFVDTGDLDAVARAMRPGATKLVFVETPANPVWTVTDIAAAAVIAHDAGAQLAVDSTAATPVLTRPLELGADLVVHAATKYLNGHSDLLAGFVAVAREDALWERINRSRHLAGAVSSAMDAWLLARGMRTLFVRVERQCRSAMAFARHFEDHPKIAQVCYPGLESFPGHEIARRQMTGGFGGMLSLRLRDGAEAALAVARRTRLFLPATSFGGVESLIEHRFTIEGEGSLTPPDLLRLSIGLEAVEDLIADIEQALA